VDGFLTVREASEYLKVKGSTLYAWAERGAIPYYKFGRLVRFKKAEIEAWADSQRIDKAREPCEFPADVTDIGNIIEFAKSSVLSSSSGKARPASKRGGG
jgi:excisionase family DNA binding protein